MSHLLLHGYELLPNSSNRAHSTNTIAHLDGANLALHQIAIDIYVAGTTRRVKAEVYVYIIEHSLNLGLLDDARVYRSMLQGVERDSTVHSARVDKYITKARSYGLGKGTLTARRMTVDGDDNPLIIHYRLTY